MAWRQCFSCSPPANLMLGGDFSITPDVNFIRQMSQEFSFHQWIVEPHIMQAEL